MSLFYLGFTQFLEHVTFMAFAKFVKFSGVISLNIFQTHSLLSGTPVIQVLSDRSLRLCPFFSAIFSLLFKLDNFCSSIFKFTDSLP